MPGVLDPELKRALAERVRFYNELGIYDFYRRNPYRRNPTEANLSTGQDVLRENPAVQPEQREEMTPRSKAVAAVVVSEEELSAANSKPESGLADPVKALHLIREVLGDCTRCRLSKQGRKQIVFGVGNPKAELMFIGEAPGADEDQQGEPFVGRAGELLTKIIQTMGFERSEVYIANVLKCRPDMPPGASGNRQPTPGEMETCL